MTTLGPRKPWRILLGLGLAAFFLLLGLALTTPLARYFTTGIPYTRSVAPGGAVQHNIAGDHLQLYYRFWVFSDALAGHSPFFRNAYEFSTAPGKQPQLSSYFTPYQLIFAAVRPWSGAAGYNAAVLASFLFSGFTLYFLIFFYTGDRLASLVGGAVFAAAPFRCMALLSGHPTGFSMFYLPLVVLCLEKTLAERSWRWSLAAGLAFVATVDNDLHGMYLTSILVPLVVLRHLVGRAPRRWGAEVRALLLPGTIFVVLAGGALAFKLIRLSDVAYAAEARSLQEILLFTPSIHTMIQRTNASQPTYTYLGLVALLLVLCGAVAAWRARAAEGGRPALSRMLFFLGLFGGSYVLVFGPRFPLPAPWYFLYHHFPKFALIRQSSKLMILSTFALAVLAGLAFAALRRRLPGRKGVVLAVVLLGAVAVDSSTIPSPGATISLLPAAVPSYEEVFRERPGSRVVNVPIWPGNDAWSSHYLYYATLYRTVMVNGYRPVLSRDYVEQVFRPLIGLNAGQLQERQYDLLRGMKVDYLVFHEESFPPKVCPFPSQYALDNLLASPFLSLASGTAPVWVFRILPPAEVRSRQPQFLSSVVAWTQPAGGAGEVRDDAEASTGRALYSGGAFPAFALQRARTTPAGNYTLSLRLKPEGTARFSLSVRRSEGDAIVAERSFVEEGSGYRTVTLDFALEESTSVYYFLDKPEGVGLTLDWLYVRFADQLDPLESFTFNELFHTGNSAPHERASGGRALHLPIGEPPGEATRGPYRLYEEGRYLLTVSLAHGGGNRLGKDEVVASVALRNHLDDGAERDRAPNLIMPPQPIVAGAFRDPSGLTDFTFPFTLDRPTFLSVNVQHTGLGLSLDRVSVRRVAE